ncbi:hypothetical protein ACWCO3_22350, partial [Micromonospora sp. NPDC002411]
MARAYPLRARRHPRNPAPSTPCPTAGRHPPGRPTVLADPRSWIASGELRVQRVADAGAADFTIYL